MPSIYLLFLEKEPEKKKKLFTKQHFSKKEYTPQHQIKNHTEPGNSQSRRLKSPSSTMKTIIVVNS